MPMVEKHEGLEQLLPRRKRRIHPHQRKIRGRVKRLVDLGQIFPLFVGFPKRGVDGLGYGMILDNRKTERNMAIAW